MKMRVISALVAVVWLAFAASILAQERKTTEKEVPDGKYGEGVHHFLRVWDDTQKPYNEIWIFKDPEVKEIHDFENGHFGERWWFHKSDHNYMLFTIEYKEYVTHEDDGWYFVQDDNSSGLYNRNVNKIWFPNKEAARKMALAFINVAEKQFAKDQTLLSWTQFLEQRLLEESSKTEAKSKVEPSSSNDKPKEIEKNVEQPTLPPNESLSGTSVGSPCGALAGEVVFDKTKAAIAEKIAHIEARRTAMADAFYHTGAVATLQAAFKAKGVTTSMRYADSWGGAGIGLTWSQSATPFYDYHRDAFTESLKVLEERHATESELAILDQALQAWDVTDREIETQFRALVDAYTAEAKVLDEKDAYYVKYYATLQELTARSDTAGINALNMKMARDSKAFDDRANQLETVDQKARVDEIKRLGAKQLFTPLQKDFTADKACK